MKKKVNISLVITIGVVCFILVMVMFMQFKIIYETDVTSIETMREQELQDELANWKNKYEEANAQYAEITNTLKKYKEESTSDTETRKNLEEELEKLNLMLGKTDVEGQGIIITLEDGENEDKQIDADELMIIVNYLKDAEAEAISINNQRIINNTYFSYINGSFIKVNSQRVSSPYEIKVIGNPNYLKSALMGSGGYAEKIISWGQKINIDEKKKVSIPKYSDDITIKYIEE